MFNFFHNNKKQQNRKLYESILNSEAQSEIITSLAYDDPLTDTTKIGNASVSSLKIGNNSVIKIAIGSTLVYDSTAQGGGGGVQTLALTDAATNQCYEEVSYVFGDLPAGTTKLTATAVGIVEAGGTSTVTATYTSFTTNTATTLGTGGIGGKNILLSHQGASNPKAFRLRGQYDRPIDSATLTVLAKNSSDTVLASGTISGLSSDDCSD